MGKIRVYELARELKLPNVMLLNILSLLKISASSYMSSLTSDNSERVRSLYHYKREDIQMCDKGVSIEKNNWMDVMLSHAVLMSLKDELNCTFDELYEQTKKLGFSERVDKGNILTEEEKNLLRNKIKNKSDENQEKNEYSDLIKGKNFIIDGSNICGSYFQKEKIFSIKTLLSIICEILTRGGNFISIFDANIMHKIQNNRKDELQYFKTLHSSWPDKFCLSTGGIPADDFILANADQTGDSIISNDLFREFAFKYQWISKQERLIKGKIVGEKISIPYLNIFIPICKRPKNAINTIRAKLS